jgi:hypothetical protein
LGRDERIGVSMVVESDEIKSSTEEVGIIAVAATGAEAGSSAAVEPSTKATAGLGEGVTTGGVPVPETHQRPRPWAMRTSTYLLQSAPPIFLGAQKVV